VSSHRSAGCAGSLGQSCPRPPHLRCAAPPSRRERFPSASPCSSPASPPMRSSRSAPRARRRGGVQPIAALWFATFSLAPGFFLPLEQELGRALSHRRANGDGGLPVVKRVVQLGAIITTIVLVALLAASPVIATEFFDGDWWMVAALVTAFVAYAPAHLARGVCAGTRPVPLLRRRHGLRRRRPDRGVPGLLAAIGITRPARTASSWRSHPLVAVSPSVPGAAAHRAGSSGTVARGDPEPRVAAARHRLLRGTAERRSVAAQLLSDADQKELVTQFGYGVLLARIPLFMFQAVQAALLPRLSGSPPAASSASSAPGYLRLMQLVTVVGVLGTAGAFVLGPVGDRAGVRCRPGRPHTRDAGPVERALHGRARDGTSGDRPPGPRARGPRLGHGRRRVPARHVAVERSAVPPDRDRARALERPPP
jgi:hypothetical protein